MNWEAVGAIGEILGALGVIASLLYLATQIRHATRASRAAAGETAIRSFRDILTPVFADPDLVQLYPRLWLDATTYSGPDRDRAFLIMFQVMKASESIHFHYLNGMLDPGTWQGWSSLLVNHVNTAGFQTYWAERGDIYSPAFQKWVGENALHTEGKVPGNLRGRISEPEGTA